MVSGNLLGIAARVRCAATNFPRERFNTISFQGAIDAKTGGLETMITIEIPSDSLRTKVVLGPQVKDLLNVSGRYLPRVTLCRGFLTKQSIFSSLL
jgi:hypothetical protein